MIPGIGEYTRVNGVLNEGFPSYATLHQAEAAFADMGERTITTQVRIDGDIAPNFDGWELTFKGERFVLPIKEPQAVKDNTTRNSLVDLVFRSWVVEELKRYFYFQPASINASTAIADQYQASVRMTLANFVRNFNTVLQHYWPLTGGANPSQIVMVLNPSAATDTNLYLVEIDHVKIWEVLTKFYEIFHQRWYITTTADGIYQIRVGYDPEEIQASDHLFQYGYDGGLLRFERQVQDEDITNILLGRGGEKNLPYRYFKLVDPQNDSFAADPDAIPELANIYFDRLHDINFRWYVRGWMQNPNRDTSWDATHTFPTYTESDCPADYLFAFIKGKTDEKFDPVEYVKDDESIAKYGEHWGALDDNDDIFPTIQGRQVPPFGRIDESVAFSEITTDDIQEASEVSAVELSVAPMLYTFYPSRWTRNLRENIVQSEPFVVPSGKVALVRAKWVDNVNEEDYKDVVHIDTVNSRLEAISSGHSDSGSIGKTSVVLNITEPGEYRLKLSLAMIAPADIEYLFTGTFGLTEIVVSIVDATSEGWAPTFDVWVKNIWNTQKLAGETDEEYAERVWLPILGDHLGSEAKMVFTSGLLATSSDYEFTIVSIPVFDDTRTINGVPSHWRITLAKSDAEWQALGVYIPSTKCHPVAGDTFYFVGIDMPHYYTVLAEQELNTYKTANLDSVADIAPTWVVGLDKVRVHTEEDADLYGKIADRLKAGMLLHLTDPRFLPDGLALYVQSITYKWEEPTDEQPYIVPDIEVVLSDKIVSQTGAVAKLQGQVNSIQSEYVRADQVEETVRRIASATYLKKTGESDSSDSPTTFSSKVTSKDFKQGGVGGSGWGIYKTNATAIASDDANAEQGESVLEFDRVIVRKELQINTLVVNQIEARAGKEILSAARMLVNKVIFDEASGLYRLYFDQKQGSVENTFKEGDIALCQQYSSDWDSTPTKYYRMVVEETHPDHIAIIAESNDGSGVPEQGDVVVQYGSMIDTSRQYVIIRDIIGGGFEKMLSGLSCAMDGNGTYTYSSGVEYYFAGRENGSQPRWFVGDRSSRQYIEYANGHLTIMGPASVGGVLGSTEIAGNFVQTGEISLGQVSDNALIIYSGISGIYNASALGGGIAAWYGGPKVDHEVDASATTYARSLFRFDGSGYLASGNIKWNAAGAGSIPGISWNGNTIIIDSEVKFRNINDNLVGLVDSVKTLTNMFVLEGSGTTADPYRIKALHGLYSDSFISAGGLNSESGGGGGGASSLSELNDVRLSTLSSGQMLIYNGSYWVNSAVPSASGTLITNLSAAQTVSAGESLAGTIRLHKVAKTGAYGDLRGTPDLSVYVVNSDLLNYIGKVTGATADNVAVFASGGGLADSGIAKSGLALLAGNQTFTGNNTFQYTVRANGGVIAHGVTLSDLSDAIYATVGTNTIKPIFRTYTDETSGQGDLNFGVDPGAGGTATHDVNFVGKRVIFRNANYADAGSTAMVFASDANYIYRDLIPGADRTYALGSNNGYFKEGHIEDIYVKSFIPWKQQGATIEGDPNTASGGYNFYTIDANGRWNNGLALTPSEAIVGSQLRPESDGDMSLGLADYRWGDLFARYIKATDSLEAGSIYAYNNAASFDFYVGNGSGGWLKALQLNNTQIEANRNLVPNANQYYDLGVNGLHWRYLFANRWYPNGANGPYIEYDSARTSFKVNGNMYVTGFLTAGASGQNDVQSSISYSLVPTQDGAHNLGSEGSKFGTLYANTVRATAIHTTDLTVTNLDYKNWVAWGADDYDFGSLLDGSTHSNLTLSNYGISNSDFSDILSGKIVTIKLFENDDDVFHITEAHLSGNRYITIYFGRKFRLVQTSATRFTIYGTLN